MSDATLTALKTFAPKHLTRDAEQSGFFQCPECGLVWFGRNDIEECPSGHAKPVHVAILCRTCDAVIPLERFAAHLTSEDHLQSSSW